MGAEVVRTHVVRANGGFITKVLRTDSPHFKGFGEMYTSTINFGVFRGWKVHKKMDSLLMVCDGEVEVHIVEQGGNCYTVKLSEFWVTNEILSIAAGTTFGFRCSGGVASTVMNLASYPHEEGESMKLQDCDHRCGWLP